MTETLSLYRKWKKFYIGLIIARSRLPSAIAKKNHNSFLVMCMRITIPHPQLVLPSMRDTQLREMSIFK